MRTSLAIACLAGVALASKSKSYRNKHTAATAERPAGDCLTMEAYFDLSDTACDDIWIAWKSQCKANMTDECNQAEDDIWGVPACAATPDVACDIGFLLESEDLVCNEQWMAFGEWCTWWGVANDPASKSNCDEVYLAAALRIGSDDQDMLVMQKTQMQEVHFLQQKKRAGKKQQTAAAAPRPTGECLTKAAYNYQSEDDNCNAIWRAWDLQCVDWTDACTEAEAEVWGVAAWAPPPTCSFMSRDNDQECTDAWDAFSNWCMTAVKKEEFDRTCKPVFESIEELVDDAVVMRKTQMQEVHFLQQKKRAGKKQQTPAAAAPRPTGECLTVAAYAYESEDAYCNDIWVAWDLQCANDWTDACTEAQADLFGVAEYAPLPTCSFLEIGTDPVCSEAWMNFNFWCTTGDRTEAQVDECDAALETIKKLLDDAAVYMRKTTMQRKHELKKSAAGKHALERTAAKERSGKKASVNLAASSSAANDGQYASGVAMGAAVGAAAALGALVAISKCNKGRVDDFQRV